MVLHKYKSVFYNELEGVINGHSLNIIKYYEDRNRCEASIQLLEERVMLESVEIMRELAGRLNLERLEIRAKQENIEKYGRYWHFLDCDTYVDNSDYSLKIFVLGKCIGFVSNSILILNVGSIFKIIENIEKVERKVQRYYVISNDRDMLYERFVVANRIRKNGGVAFYDIGENTYNDLKLDGNNWIIVEFDKELYDRGRCKIYHYCIGGDQLSGEVYIDNLGKKSYS